MNMSLARPKEKIQENIVFALKLIFALAILHRVLMVFIYSPMDHLFSDPYRHFENAMNFMIPSVMGSADPFMYQLWLHLWRSIDGENKLVFNISAAILSAAMPFFWYKTFKEITTKIPALIGACIIGFHPTFTIIYSYFMNETLLLTLIAAAFWLSFRAERRGSFSAWGLAVIFWTLACYTRIVALPMASVVLLYVLVSCYLKKRPSLMYFVYRISVTFLLFAVVAVPSCWHSRISLNFCAPFGSGYIPKIQYYSLQKGIGINILEKGSMGYMPPSLVNKPLSPFSDWQTHREGEANITIDTKNGRSDWESELARVKAEPKKLSIFYRYWENALLFFFDYSWPDNNAAYLPSLLAIVSRWFWLPCVLLVTVLTFRSWKLVPHKQMLIPVLSLMLTGYMLIQDKGIVEGRYRKPIEPLWIASLVLLWRKPEDGKSLI